MGVKIDLSVNIFKFKILNIENKESNSKYVFMGKILFGILVYSIY